MRNIPNGHEMAITKLYSEKTMFIKKVPLVNYSIHKRRSESWMAHK